MTKDQKIVATGAASGILTMALLVWLLSRAIAAPLLDGSAERLAYALPWAVVAAVPLFMMLAAVGNARFLSEAIDPTLGKEDQKTLVNGRVADNTLQQFAIFAVALLALSVTLPGDRLSFVPATAITFVIARIAFWIGYRIHPLYRAPGFSSTAYLNLGMIVAVLWMWLR
jgi:uncharacterized MAPEG superfamily protein